MLRIRLRYRTLKLRALCLVLLQLRVLAERLGRGRYQVKARRRWR